MDKLVDVIFGELVWQCLVWVLVVQGKVEEGLKLFDGDVDKVYVLICEEFRGDLLVQFKCIDEVCVVYEKVKQLLFEDGVGDVLQIKFDDLFKGEV